MDSLGSFIGGAFGLAGSAMNYGFQKKLAEQQNQYNLDMWRMQNEYNSPSAQMLRFKDAGLNPNLIYGQGSAGNAQSAPQMVTPRAPEVSEDMARLAQAFNVEGLKTQIANRKEAEANAHNAKTNARRNFLTLRAEENFGRGWTYDYNLGKYVQRPALGPNEVRVVHPSAYYFNRILEGNYNRAALIPYRAALLAPQIQMLQYDQRNYPVSYWIGQGTKVTGAASDVVNLFKPANWVVPQKFPRSDIHYNTYYNRSWNKYVKHQ